MPGRCSKCSGPISFVRMRNGSVMPVDPIPTVAGNVVAMRAGGSRWIDGIVRRNADVGTPPPHGYSALVTHFATCPDRTPKRKPAPPAPTLFDAVPEPEPPPPF